MVTGCSAYRSGTTGTTKKLRVLSSRMIMLQGMKTHAWRAGTEELLKEVSMRSISHESSTHMRRRRVHYYMKRRQGSLILVRVPSNESRHLGTDLCGTFVSFDYHRFLQQGFRTFIHCSVDVGLPRWGQLCPAMAHTIHIRYTHDTSSIARQLIAIAICYVSQVKSNIVHCMED